MDKGYYTPTIEEFHVGFEIEEWDIKEEEDWVKITVSSEGYKKHPHCEIRVKYLDQEDMEELGFKFIETSHENSKWFQSETALTIVEDKGKYGIFYMYRPRHTNLFNGTIKNKSELKRVLKQIGYESNKENS